MDHAPKPPPTDKSWIEMESSNRVGQVVVGVLLVIAISVVVVLVLMVIAAGENCRDRGGSLVGGYDGYVCVERR